VDELSYGMQKMQFNERGSHFRKGRNETEKETNEAFLSSFVPTDESRIAPGRMESLFGRLLKTIKMYFQKRRADIEPVIIHLKVDYWVARDF